MRTQVSSGKMMKLKMITMEWTIFSWYHFLQVSTLSATALYVSMGVLDPIDLAAYTFN